MKLKLPPFKGTKENLLEILKVLDGWQCTCSPPYFCGCQDGELESTLAKAHQLIGDRIAELEMK